MNRGCRGPWRLQRLLGLKGVVKERVAHVQKALSDDKKEGSKKAQDGKAAAWDGEDKQAVEESTQREVGSGHTRTLTHKAAASPPEG